MFPTGWPRFVKPPIASTPTSVTKSVAGWTTVVGRRAAPEEWPREHASNRRRLAAELLGHVGLAPRWTRTRAARLGRTHSRWSRHLPRARERGRRRSAGARPAVGVGAMRIDPKVLARAWANMAPMAKAEIGALYRWIRAWRRWRDIPPDSAPSDVAGLLASELGVSEAQATTLVELAGTGSGR